MSVKQLAKKDRPADVGPVFGERKAEAVRPGVAFHREL
jgi:hypothetical protein